MQIPHDKIIYIAVISIFFTIVFIPLLRYFVISYFKELKNDILSLELHNEKITKRMIEIDDRCADRGKEIGVLQGRLNGK